MDRHEIDPNEAQDTERGFVTEDLGERRVDCDEDTDRCAPDESDPDLYTTRNIPGTVDDIPVSLGEQIPHAPEEHVVPADAPVHTSVRQGGGGQDAEPLGQDDEAALWRAQKPLIDEDEQGGYKLEGFDESAIPEILEAMGDDAAEPLAEYPNGVSATGSTNTPDHGGFPEREE